MFHKLVRHCTVCVASNGTGYTLLGCRIEGIVPGETPETNIQNVGLGSQSVMTSKVGVICEIGVSGLACLPSKQRGGVRIPYLTFIGG